MDNVIRLISDAKLSVVEGAAPDVELVAAISEITRSIVLVILVEYRRSTTALTQDMDRLYDHLNVTHVQNKGRIPVEFVKEHGKNQINQFMGKRIHIADSMWCQVRDAVERCTILWLQTTPSLPSYFS